MIYNNKVIPVIVNAGVFDASIICKTDKTPNRRVSLYEIEMPIGNGGYSYINNKKYKRREHEIICAKPGSMRHTQLPFKCFYIHLMVEDEYFKSLLNQLPDVLIINEYGKTQKLFKSLIEEYNFPHENNELLIHAKLLELIYTIHCYALLSKNQSRVNDNNIVNASVKYINEHYLERLDLKNIADYVHLSRIYFCKVFKTAVGITPHKYIISLKISEAQKMLLMSDKSLSEIAYSCGFSSQSYFNYVFKRQLNVTPMEYRLSEQKKYLSK